MKSILKIIGGLFILNLILANLRQEGVISGGITIHYPRLIQKLSENTMIYFVNSDAQMYPAPNSLRMANSLNEPGSLAVVEPEPIETTYEPMAPDLGLSSESDLAPAPIDLPNARPEYQTPEAYNPDQPPPDYRQNNVHASSHYRQLSEIPFTDVPAASASNLPVYENQEPEEPLEDLFEDLSAERDVHILKQGETLMTLSSIYGISWKKIQAYNAIRDVCQLHPGQKIFIPAS